jgi:aminoglycoside phosphotransferase (APT) family kinase protein
LCISAFSTLETLAKISYLQYSTETVGGRGRERGRPRLEWEEYVERLASKRGRKLPEVKRLAQDRKEYRKWLLEPDA